MEGILNLSTEFKVAERGRRYFAEIGSEDHGRPSFILWVNRRVPVEEREEYGLVKKYIAGADVKIAPVKSGSSRAKNLIPAKGWHTVRVEVPAGYRGDSWFRIYKDRDDEDPICVDFSTPYIVEKEGISVAPFAVFHSERGTLGITMGAIISSRHQHFLIEWWRSGRTYGAPTNGVSICYPERGEIFDYPNIGIADIEDIEY